MKQTQKYYLFEFIILAFMYGSIYFVIETIWKGQFTDIRMFFLGGLLGILIGLQNNVFTYDTDFLFQMINGSIMITLCEAIFGYQWNIVEGLHLWDYTNTWIYGVGGNVSLLFSIFAWIPLSGICIIVDDLVWYFVFHKGAKPYYKIFNKIIYKF